MAETRKLAAILASDVVGYSRLASIDEDRILARLRALRSDLIDPTIAVHNGRVVKRTGDGSIVEFRSVVDAVRCAIEVQNAMVERNAGLPPDRRIEFRIGIHLGDVVEESDGDLMGDGVNIAARLEGVAAPGTICLSEDAYRQVRARLDLSVSDLGQTQLKNIAEPLRVYSLAVGNGTGPQPAIRIEPGAVTVSGSESQLQNKPSIAVLPFSNMSGDPEQEYFADGVVDDITTALSRFNQLFVIARNSSFTYKGRATDVRQIARELGVRYVLEGGIRKAGNRLRITGQLIDASNGSHLWANKFDGDLEDVFTLQDKITESVVGAIEPMLRKAEIDRARRKPTESLDAYDLYLRALPHVYAMRPDRNLAALQLLNSAIELDPHYAPALAHAAWCYEQRLVRGWPPAAEDDVAQGTALARRAIEAGDDDAVPLVLAGFFLVMVARDYDAGFDSIRRAVESNPGSGFVALIACAAHAFAGSPDQALVYAHRGMSLSPLDPSFFMYLTNAAGAHLFTGRPAEALDLAKRAIALYPDWDTTYWILIPALVRLGKLPEAHAALAHLLRLAPGLTVTDMRNRLPTSAPKALGIILDGLRQAGLPE